jgi:hypothetical protein
MRNIVKKVIKKTKTRFIFNNLLVSENRAICEIMWKNVVEPDRPQKTIRHMRIACWILKAAKTLSIYDTYYFSIATMVARKHLNIE